MKYNERVLYHALQHLLTPYPTRSATVLYHTDSGDYAAIQIIEALLTLVRFTQ